MRGLGILCLAVDLILIAEIGRRFGMDTPIPMQWKIFLVVPVLIWLLITLFYPGDDRL